MAETVHDAPGTTRLGQDSFELGTERQPRLLERVQSTQEVSADGSVSTVRSTWVPDVNGQLALSSRRVEATASLVRDIHHSEATLLVPGINEALRESERTESSDHQVSPRLVQHDSTEFVRDLNGRWLAAEARSGDARDLGSSERLEEETIQRQDLSGNLTVSEKTLTRSSGTHGRTDVVIESYAQNAEGFVRSDDRLALSRRVRRSTTAGADGGREIVEEVEARSPVSPGDSMRVIQRSVVTVRKIGPDRWVTERRVFELDLNGRLVPVLNETEETSGK